MDGLCSNLMEPNEDGLLTPAQEEYLEWLCTSVNEREPKLKWEIAQKIGVTIHTLRAWEKKAVFMDKWKAGVENTQGSPERTQVLLDSLYERGIAGDVKSAQLFFQATNRLAPSAPPVVTEKRTAELTDVELDALILESAKRQQAERKGVKSNHPAVLRLVP